MTIKKMTMAAALSVGLVAGSMGLAFADCGCKTPVMTGGACPLKTHQRVNSADTCNKCKKHKNDCGCKKVSKCDDKCAKPKKCSPCEDSIATCDEPDIPTAGVCPNNPCAEMCKHQMYAFPANIYGLDNVRVGETDQGVLLSHDGINNTINANCGCATPMLSGIPVATAPDCGCETGAALPMPCLNDCNGKINGIPVARDCNTLDGMDCPINIETESSMDVLKKSMVPFTYTQESTLTGAAAPVVSAFEDVPDGFWASCDINKLTENKVIAGYPDRTFKPNLPVSRAEFASMAVKGLNLNDNYTCPEANFKDVPKDHWANKVINTSVAEGLMTGYPNNTFKPNHPVTRAEALTILSKGVKCDMDNCKAKEVLSKYCDGSDVPAWATIPVAKTLNAGAIADLPNPNEIRPNSDASRAELASMLEQVRIAGGYSTKDIATTDPNCGCTGAAAYMEKSQTVTIPTLKICFDDELTARTAHVNDRFAAKTIAPMTINGVLYPEGSTVRGKVLEVERPSRCNDGALKLSFDTIENCDCKTDLPNQVLSAQVNRTRTPNVFARFVQWPFATVGQVVGTAGRAVGGAAISVSNAFEQVVSEFGTGTGEIFQGQFKAAGRSYLDSAKALVKAPIDLTRTAISGVSGMVQVTGQEVAYLVDPDGKKISAINPREKVTIAFGCNSCR